MCNSKTNSRWQRTIWFRWFRHKDRGSTLRRAQNHPSKQCPNSYREISSCNSKIVSSCNKILSKFLLRIRGGRQVSNQQCLRVKSSYSNPTRELTSWNSSRLKISQDSNSSRFSCRLIWQVVLVRSVQPSWMHSKKSTICQLLKSFRRDLRIRWKLLKLKHRKRLHRSSSKVRKRQIFSITWKEIKHNNRSSRKILQILRLIGCIRGPTWEK